MRKKIRSLILLYSLIFTLLLFFANSTSKIITALSDEKLFNNRKCVIIDPGHGGVDGGATSCTGIVESSINLEISLRLNDLLHLIGVDTIMIRSSDISVYKEGTSIAQKKISDLRERVRIVNEKVDAILISIHQNHFSEGKYYGPQVFYNNETSKAFAKSMQRSLIENLCPENKRKEKKSIGIYLMEKVKCPGLLIECGFLSNPEEEAKLRNDSYQKALSAVIAISCANYLSANSIT